MDTANWPWNLSTRQGKAFQAGIVNCGGVPEGRMIPVTDYLFTEYWRDHRPLLGLLNQWASPARSWAGMLRAAEFTELSDIELLNQVLRDWRLHAKPLIRQPAPQGYQEPGLAYRRQDNELRLAHWRWLFKFPVSGNLELLQAWPAKLDIEPCSSDLYDAPAPQMVWQITPGGPIVIFDVPATDDADGTYPPRDRLTAASNLLDGIIELANDEMIQYEELLKSELLTTIARRRARLHTIHQRTQEAIELVARERPPLQIEEAVSTATNLKNSMRHESLDLPVAASRKTFAELVNFTQKWVMSTQKYPSVFAKMEEEEITSVLVAALNLTFDTAQREVFVGNGKSDVYIESELGDRTRAAYVGESKIWSGPGGVEKHLRQLLGYAASHIREVMFIYYVKHKGFDAIQNTATTAIAACGDLFVRWVEVGKRAVMQHPDFGHEVEVAIIYAHFPK